MFSPQQMITGGPTNTWVLAEPFQIGFYSLLTPLYLTGVFSPLF